VLVAQGQVPEEILAAIQYLAQLHRPVEVVVELGLLLLVIMVKVVVQAVVQLMVVV
jgi:hypothetical protein